MKELMLKGFEVELFTGSNTGKHVGVSGIVSKEFPDFVKEPDQRNLEYITPVSYTHLTLPTICSV